MNKIYKCEKCGKICDEKKPIRIQVQKYGIGRYKQYATYKHYDLCINCFKVVNHWINKCNV